NFKSLLTGHLVKVGVIQESNDYGCANRMSRNTFQILNVALDVFWMCRLGIESNNTESASTQIGRNIVRDLDIRTRICFKGHIEDRLMVEKCVRCDAISLDQSMPINSR